MVFWFLAEHCGTGYLVHCRAAVNPHFPCLAMPTCRMEWHRGCSHQALWQPHPWIWITPALQPLPQLPHLLPSENSESNEAGKSWQCTRVQKVKADVACFISLIHCFIGFIHCFSPCMFHCTRHFIAQDISLCSMHFITRKDTKYFDSLLVFEHIKRSVV